MDEYGQSIHNPRKRVICYITRNRNELLVFEHNDPGLETGLQVVAGGIDQGELPEQAALREVWEEAGLKIEHAIFLGDVVCTPPHATVHPFQHWFFYWLEANFETRNEWLHTVSAGEEDAGMVYRQHFVKINNAKLAENLSDMLEKLKDTMWGFEPLEEFEQLNEFSRSVAELLFRRYPQWRSLAKIQVETKILYFAIDSPYFQNPPLEIFTDDDEITISFDLWGGHVLGSDDIEGYVNCAIERLEDFLSERMFIEVWMKDDIWKQSNDVSNDYYRTDRYPKDANRVYWRSWLGTFNIEQKLPRREHE